MGISIRGIRVDSLSISQDDDGAEKVTGSYSLMSNRDKVLAKQTFNGYSDIKITFSAGTVKALNEFKKGAKTDVEAVLGLTE